MPFTPYHFGPSGFVGLLFRRWLNVPVFIAANVLIDLEVLADSGINYIWPLYLIGDFEGFAPGYPVHQIWHFHTLLIGGLAGAILGTIIYYVKPLRWICEKFMDLIGLPGRSTLMSMVLAGVLGAWVHVFIDSLCHYDVQIFWPHQNNLIFRWINGGKTSNTERALQLVVLWCCTFWGLMFGLYSLILAFRLKRKKTAPATRD